MALGGVALGLAAVVACGPYRARSERRCGPPEPAEIQVLQRFERAVASAVRIASVTVPTADWLSEPADLGAWVGVEGLAAWKTRAACPLALGPILPAERLFDPRRDAVLDEDGWVLLGRVALSADGDHAALPLWSSQQHPPSCCPPFPAAWVFEYQRGVEGWEFSGSRSILGPEQGERLVH